jgi:hypothetical protein
MNYTDFFSAKDVATFKRVKKGTMILARIAREEAASIVGGRVNSADSELVTSKEFVRTRLGVFRLCMASNSDNSTEALFHDELGVITVVMSDLHQMAEWFAQHGAPKGSLAKFQRLVAMRMEDEVSR